ncbi:MAG: MBOAT family protein, partial [Lachnospiraceae bacterium]|nr:MBOAT family protein [Lachnospiraceae bacterium]
MVFSSIVFAFIFLPIVVVLYFLAKPEYRNYILLAASLIFYSYGEPRFVFIMIISIIINYLLARLIDIYKYKERIRAAKTVLVIDIAANLLLLFVFKYLNFSVTILNTVFKIDMTNPGIALPIGISFFTFQALSYCIDVYRGTVKVQKNPLYLALYISFFPQLIAGPIVRYSLIEDSLKERTITAEDFSTGAKRFMLGFIKKIVLANNLAVVSSNIWSHDPSALNSQVLWLGSICFSLQIFYDFSAYSDMAIGLGRIFGFRYEENFNYPYISSSVTEFWNRWHISLSHWFRDYVYIPLGGSRVKVARHIINLFIVWLLTGIWHGANYTFIVWGLMYFVLLVFEKYVIHPEKRYSVIFKIIWHIFTLVFVNFGWVIFNSNNLEQAMSFCMGMVGVRGFEFTMQDFIVRYMREYG